MMQLLLGLSAERRVVVVHPMSLGDPTINGYESRVGKPLLYSTDLAVIPGRDYINALPNELLRECFEPIVPSRWVLTENRGEPSQSKTPASSRSQSGTTASSLSESETTTTGLPRQGTVNSGYSRTRYSSAQSISLTCRRFCAIVKPMLYSWIHASPSLFDLAPETQPSRSLMCFFRTINTAPDLTEYITGLSLSMAHFLRITFPLSFKKIHFKRLREVELVVMDAWCDCKWDVCCTILRDLPALSALSVYLSSETDCSFQPFYRMLGQFKCLSKLVLKGVRNDQAFHELPISADEDRALHKARSDIDQGIQGTLGSASFTQLHLLDFDHGYPAELRHFLSLPSSLECFTLSTVGIGGYPYESLLQMGLVSYPWNFVDLRQSLIQHRLTLRVLRIRQLGPEQESFHLFDIHPFETLHTLQLCKVGLPSPDVACNLWLTPQVQNLVLESLFNDSQCGIVWYFTDQDVAWLAAFSTIAAGYKTSGISGLCSIEVIYVTIEDDPRMLEIEVYETESRLSFVKTMVEENGFDFVWHRELRM